jgi:hypothetical protein
MVKPKCNKHIYFRSEHLGSKTNLIITKISNTKAKRTGFILKLSHIKANQTSSSNCVKTEKITFLFKGQKRGSIYQNIKDLPILVFLYYKDGAIYINSEKSIPRMDQS